MKPGTNKVAMMTAKTAPRPLNGIRANAYAAMDATTSTITECSVAATTELTAHISTGFVASLKITRKASSVNSSGMMFKGT